MVSLLNFSRFLKIVTHNCTKINGPDLLTNQMQFFQNFSVRNYRRIRGVPRYLPWNKENPEYETAKTDQDYQSEIYKEDEKINSEICNEINKQIAEDRTGRLFAYIHLAGKQYRITESDLVVVRGYWPPQPGDEIVLEKVLLVGSRDFTLVGRPILDRELVQVDATVIEKTFSHTITHFRFRKRKQYRRIHFFRIPLTMLRINSINLKGRVDQKLEIQGLDRVY